jgi:hypothetical protein
VQAQLAAVRPAAPTGLHIGTLEVRVVPPPAAPLPAARPVPRAPARATAPAGRIARGFGVFGLGQS